MSGETEYVDDDIVIFKWIFFTEVTIILRIPKAACTHVESTVTFLQNDHVSGLLNLFEIRLLIVSSPGSAPKSMILNKI